jgi:hypothetical protein
MGERAIGLNPLFRLSPMTHLSDFLVFLTSQVN